MASVDKLLDEMIAWNLSTHVMEGYEFLMQNCQSDSFFIRLAFNIFIFVSVQIKPGIRFACLVSPEAHTLLVPSRE